MLPFGRPRVKSARSTLFTLSVHVPTRVKTALSVHSHRRGMLQPLILSDVDNNNSSP